METNAYRLSTNGGADVLAVDVHPRSGLRYWVTWERVSTTSVEPGTTIAKFASLGDAYNFAAMVADRVERAS